MTIARPGWLLVAGTLAAALIVLAAPGAWAPPAPDSVRTRTPAATPTPPPIAGPGVPPPAPDSEGATDAKAGCRPGAGNCFAPHGGLGCEWGPCCELVCAIMPECCVSGWDELCAEMAAELCERPPACRVGLGDCLQPDKERGCGDRGCCELVCAIDPFCCTTRWDSLCAAAATETCGVGDCVIVTGPALEEGEVCGEPLNDGCDQPEAFAAGSIFVGETIVGRTYAIGRRDLDWYEIATNAPVRIRLQAAFPAEVSIVTGDCEAGFTAIIATNVPACGEGFIDVPALKEPAWVVIAPGRGGIPILRGIPCVNDPDPPVRTFGDRYVLSLQPAGG